MYKKQLAKGTKNLEKRNKDKETNIEITEPTVYIRKPKVRKTDPCYDKINITAINENKISGIREKSKHPTNINKRKIKRLRKTFNLQDDPPGNHPGPSHRRNPK